MTLPLQIDWFWVFLVGVGLFGLLLLVVGNAQSKRLNLSVEDRVWIFLGQLGGGFCFVSVLLFIGVILLQRCGFFGP